MFRLLIVAGLAWLGYRIVQENSHSEPAALIPSPACLRRRVGVKVATSTE